MVAGGWLIAGFVQAYAGENAADVIARLHAEALVHSPAYDDLRHLTSTHPGRLAGSSALQGAVDWAAQRLQETGAERVRRQPVTVPHWERGAPESFFLLPPEGSDGAAEPLRGLALGWSVATPPDGLKAPLVEVSSLDALRALPDDAVRGRIVFFNRAMPAGVFTPGEAYRATGDQRNRGPALAAQRGAVGALVRSLTQEIDDVPHTGHTAFAPDQPKIPAGSLSTAAAERLSAALRARPDTQVEMRIHARWVGEARSYNVIGEIPGKDFPDRILLVGAHLDSWDVSPGAHDDGAGVVQAIEVIRLFRVLGIQPRHTLRCVLFTAEENSLAGGREYARVAREKREQHVFAIETDGGGFQPRGFELGHTSRLPHEQAARWRPLLEPYGLYHFSKGGGGADVAPLMMQGAVVADLLPVSQRYFDYHHTPVDTLEQVNPRELKLGAAAIAALIYLVDTEGLEP